MKVSMKDVLRELRRRDVRFANNDDRSEARKKSAIEAQNLWKEVEHKFREIDSRLDRIYRLWDLGRGESSMLDFINKATRLLGQTGIEIQRVQYKLKNAEKKSK